MHVSDMIVNVGVIMEDGEVVLETTVADEFVACWLEGWEVEWDEGEREMLEYCWDSEELKKECGEKLEEMREMVKGMDGVWWMWGVEYDLELCFVKK